MWIGEQMKTIEIETIKTVQIDYTHYLSEQEIEAITHELGIMETPEAAGIEALKVVQQYRGWISDESLFAIADMLQMPASQLEGVATFYNLIYRQPVGRFVIHLCDSISCHLLDYQRVFESISSHLDIEYGQTSADGMFTLLSNACLGACDKSPVMMIGKKQYTNLTPESAVSVLQSLKSTVDAEYGGDNG